MTGWQQSCHNCLRGNEQASGEVLFCHLEPGLLEELSPLVCSALLPIQEDLHVQVQRAARACYGIHLVCSMVSCV